MGNVEIGRFFDQIRVAVYKARRVFDVTTANAHFSLSRQPITYLFGSSQTTCIIVLNVTKTQFDAFLFMTMECSVRQHCWL